MSNRKLLGEIDRVLKKVDEGLIIFEQIWDKVYGASTSAQKEKYEADLKKEIKKLQRLRDQIKTWQGDSSIKDKTKLDLNRKLIEEKMEKFKVCERETKTKAFSKEGLAQDRTDPKQKAKAEVGDWVREAIAKLREQCDEFEAEIETISSGGKRKKRGEEPPRVSELKACIARHEHHVEMLERVLRAIDNEQVTSEECNEELKESVEFYIEESQDGGDYDDEGMYDALNLEGNAPTPSNAPSSASSAASSKKDKKEFPGNDVKSPVRTASPSAAGVALSAAANAAAAAAAAANAAAGGPGGTTVPGGSSSPKANRGGRSGVSATSPPSSRNGKVGGIPSPSSASRRGSGGRDIVSPTRGSRTAVPQAQSVADASGKYPSMSSVVRGQASHAAHSQDQPRVHEQQRMMHEQQQRSAFQQSQQQSQRQPPQQIPGAKDDNYASHVTGGTGGNQAFSDAASTGKFELGSSASNNSSELSALEVASTMMPDMSGSSHAATGSTGAPALPSFPSVAAPVFDNPALFEKFDPDTLFFIFYYRQGTYQQYLASRELKRQGWRYHTKYKAFFQRHEEPKIATDDYETGTFVYFDYANVVYRQGQQGASNTGWCQRIKTDFCFEYRYLE